MGLEYRFLDFWFSFLLVQVDESLLCVFYFWDFQGFIFVCFEFLGLIVSRFCEVIIDFDLKFSVFLEWFFVVIL